MKRFELPEMNISMFDAESVTMASGTGNAKAAIDALNEVNSVDAVSWNNASDWEVML